MKKKSKRNLVINKISFYKMLFLMILVGFFITWTTLFGAQYLIKTNFFQESSSTAIKEIVANETSCCFHGNGCGNGAGDYCVAKSLFDWEINNINYTHQDGVLGADETLRIKSGDCVDLSVLYCSLMKQSMLPCFYINTADHTFNYVILNNGKSYESVWIVDIANERFEKIY